MCEKHPNREVEVCGELTCGGCSEARLLAEPPPVMRQRPGLELVYDPDKHMEVVRRVRGQP